MLLCPYTVISEADFPPPLDKPTIAKLSQAPAKLDWDSFIITIPVIRPR